MEKRTSEEQNTYFSQRHVINVEYIENNVHEFDFVTFPVSYNSYAAVSIAAASTFIIMVIRRIFIDVYGTTAMRRRKSSDERINKKQKKINK